MVGNLLRFESLSCSRERFTVNSLKSFPWAVFQCATANMKVIKPQSEPNPSYFPRGALGNRSGVTARNIYNSFIVLSHSKGKWEDNTRLR